MKTAFIYLCLVHFFVVSASAVAAQIVACSHPELCRVAKIIFTENNISNFEFESLVQIKGDPHEFEPSTLEVKNLIKAEILISGPLELNPWIKKINYQRSKISNIKTINVPLEKNDYDLYPGAGHEALSHFWLYPKIFCALKANMESQFVSMKYLTSVKNRTCEAEEKRITAMLKQTLNDLKLPVVLTHDALLPLFETLAAGTGSAGVVAIKGSGHHQEASPASVKKLYDALKAPKVIWVIEDKIHVPQNITSKKRTGDLTINLDTANSQGLAYFQVLTNLNDKLKALK